MNYQEILDALTLSKSFAMARYGDGELVCMRGSEGKNTDEHDYFPDLGEALKRTLKKPKPNIIYAAADRLVHQYRKSAPKVESWASADELHKQSRASSIDKLFECLRNRNTCLVGPMRLLKLFKVAVPISEKNCWLQFEDTKERMRTIHRPGTVWLICAGMMSSVLIYDLVDELRAATLLDAGSVFDPYAGCVTRKYHTQVLARLQRHDRA